MTYRAILFAVLFGIGASGAQAACYADYKAKQDGPLKLHYGVAKLPNSACGDRKAAETVLAGRLSNAGWTLLRVVSMFDESGLDKRRESAGRFYLKY